MRRALHVLITCEHGGNRIPPSYRRLFVRLKSELDSHRGYDFGALDVARDFARRLRHAWPVDLVTATTSRLLVDLNRSIGHARLHGEPVRLLDAEERAAIVARHYQPYRSRVQCAVEEALSRGARVVHVSCHSFTPSIDGKHRSADIGLLYDPRRSDETQLVKAWRDALLHAQPRLLVRLNYPYRGTADGLTTWLRRAFPERAYAGVELEINQAFPAAAPSIWRALRLVLTGSLASALTHAAGRPTGRAADGMNAAPKAVIPSMVSALPKR